MRKLFERLDIYQVLKFALNTKRSLSQSLNERSRNCNCELTEILKHSTCPCTLKNRRFYICILFEQKKKLLTDLNVGSFLVNDDIVSTRKTLLVERNRNNVKKFCDILPYLSLFPKQ